jgi:hypothetical protein
MRRVIALAVLVAAAEARAAGTPPPSCPIGSAWTQSWTQSDTGGATGVTFNLTAPCHVLFDTNFVVTAQVTDTLCNTGTSTVGSGWKITDTRLDGSNATSTIGGVGSPGYVGAGLVRTLDGQWLTTVQQRYTAPLLPTDHRMALTFYARTKDACAGSAHFWSATVIGTTTYDPYADTSVVDPAPPASTDPGTGTSTGGSGGAPVAAAPTPSVTSTSADSGGCGSSGVTPALLGIAALAAASFPRRRRAR